MHFLLRRISRSTYNLRKETSMNATVAALLGSLVGATAALAGSVLTSIVALRTERRRQESQVQATYVRALRKRSGSAFAQFFTIVQEIEWISWLSANDPDAIDEQRIKSYDDTINAAYRTLLGSMAMTASLSPAVYDEIRPILLSLYNLEARVAMALRKISSERTAAIQELIACRSEAETLRDNLPPKLNYIMTAAEIANRRKEAQSI
jgi:hypothetical protein